MISAPKQAAAACTGLKDDAGNASFLYQHSTYDDDRDEIKIFETKYAAFADLWQMLVKKMGYIPAMHLYIGDSEDKAILLLLKQLF